MNALKLFVVAIMLVFAGITSQAQISIKVHIGTPPAWGPAGYSSVRYYYLPDVEAYYDVQNSMFIYMSGNSWVHRANLPARYKNYNLYNGYKVVMKDYHGNQPYSNFKVYKAKYARGYKGKAQRNIGVRDNRNNNQNRPNAVAQPIRTPNQNINRTQVKPNNQSQVRVNDKNQGNNKVQSQGNKNSKGPVNDKNKQGDRENGNKRGNN